MKNIKRLSFLFLLTANFAFAQNATKSQFPLIFINDAVGNLNNIDEQKIQSINVYKHDSAQQNFKQIKEFNDTGIFAVEMKPEVQFETITFSELNKKNNLSAKKPILVDGYLIENPQQKVMVDAIVKTEVIQHKSEKILCLWTHSENQIFDYFK